MRSDPQGCPWPPHLCAHKIICGCGLYAYIYIIKYILLYIIKLYVYIIMCTYVYMYTHTHKHVHKRIKVHLAHHSRVRNIQGKGGPSGEDLLTAEDFAAS